MPDERFLWLIFPIPDLLITVSKPPAGQADPEIRVIAEGATDAQLRVEIGGRYGQPQGQVGVKEVRSVAVVIRVRGQGRVPLKGYVVPELQQVTFYGINLAVGAERTQKDYRHRSPATSHAPFRSGKLTWQQV